MSVAGEREQEKTGAKIILALLFLVTIGLSAATRFQAPLTMLWAAAPILGVLQWFWFRQTKGQLLGQNIRHMLVVAGLAHAVFILVANPLYTSDDINRYVFEGHVVAAGGNPYTHPPSSPLFDDLTRERSIESIRDGVNNKRIATIYPPLAEALFAFGTCFHRGHLGWLLVLFVFDLLILFNLPKLLAAHDADQRWSVVYAFHPIVLFEGLAGGHVDLVAVSFLVCSFLFAARNKRLLAWILFALSVLTKVVSLVVGFALLKRCGWKGMIAAGALVLASIAVSFLPGAIAPTMKDGNWRLLQGQPLANLTSGSGTIPSFDLITTLNAGKHYELSNSGRTAVVFQGVNDDGAKRSESILQLENVALAKAIDWSDMVGQFRVVGFGKQQSKFDGILIRLDGQGRIYCDSKTPTLTGSYWLEENRLLNLKMGNVVFSNLELTADLQVAMSRGLYLIKTKEKIGMGFRHYNERWTANAPLFRFIKSQMPGPDEFDLRRRAAQKWVAGFLIILALALLMSKTSLPQAALLLFSALWFLAPAVYPWYLIWLVPFLGFSRCLAPLVFTYTSIAMHLTTGEISHEYFVYLPVGIAIVIDISRFFLGKRILS